MSAPLLMSRKATGQLRRMDMIHERAEVVAAYPNTDVRDAYHVGVEKGYGFVVSSSIRDIWEAYCDELGNGPICLPAILPSEITEDIAAAYASLCWEHSSQYTDESFTIRDFNAHELSEELWEAFEEGLAWGARYAWWERVTGKSLAS